MSEDFTEETRNLKNYIVDIAVEAWRFSKVFERMMMKLDAGEQGRYVNQLRWFMKKIEESLQATGLSLVSIEGHPFDPGAAAKALNIGDFNSEESLFVEQMIEPIIMDKEGIFRTGTVTLRRAEL